MGSPLQHTLLEKRPLMAELLGEKCHSDSKSFEIYLTFLKECNYIDTNRNVTLSLKNNFLLESHHLWLNFLENFLCNCFAQHLTNFYSLKVVCSLLNRILSSYWDCRLINDVDPRCHNRNMKFEIDSYWLCQHLSYICCRIIFDGLMF